MPPEDADLEAATAAASEATNPPPDPEVEPEDTGDDDEPMTLGQARKLRRENAKWRTQLQEIEKKVEGFEPDELDAYLTMGRTLLQDPVKALPDFQRVVATIQAQYPELTKDQAEEVAATVAEDEAPKSDDEHKVLTPADVAAQFRKLREEEAKEAESKSRQDAIFEEAKALDERYEVGSDYLVQLLHIARTDPEAGGTLEGAHEVLSGREKAIMDKAIEDYRKGLRDGTSHPPISQGGRAITEAKRDPEAFKNMTPKERFAAAKRSAEERISHSFS